MKKLIVYANVNLNLIDGSAIWLRSIVEMISKTECFNVHVILKQKVSGDGLKKLPFVKWIDPFSKEFSSGIQGSKLNAETALEFIDYYYKNFFKADFLIIRQVDWGVLTNWNESLLNKTFVYNISGLGDMVKHHGDILDRSGGVIVQTNRHLDFIKKVSGRDEFNSFIMPPMIPSINKGERNKNRLVYCGKFTTMWQVQEMIEAFSDLIKVNPNLEFHIAGDKFDSTVDKEKLIDLLENTQGVYWHKRLSRDESISLIKSSGIGLSYRSPELRDPMEISTKLLEYCMAGLPVIANPGTIHSDLFGKEYPLFVNSIDDFKSAILMAVEDSMIYDKASKACEKAASFFSYEESSKRFSHFFN